MLAPLQLEKEYREWLLQMHSQYDEEADSGEDQPIIIVSPANGKELGISSDGKTNIFYGTRSLNSDSQTIMFW